MDNELNNLINFTLTKYNLINYKVISLLPNGRSNYTILLCKDNTKYILRIPGVNSDKYVVRRDEYKTLELLKNSNITSDVIFFDEKTGVKLEKYIEGKLYSDIKNDHYLYIDALLDNLHKLHDIDINNFDISKIDLFKVIDDLSKDLNIKDTLFIYYYNKIKKYYNKYINKDPLYLIHGDIGDNNLIFSDNKCYFLDFEFTKLGSIYYDLANLYLMYKDLDNFDIIKLYFKTESYDKILYNKIYTLASLSLFRWYVVAMHKDKFNYLNKNNLNFKEMGLHFYKLAREEIDKIDNGKK